MDAILAGNPSNPVTVYFHAKLPFGYYQVYNTTDVYSDTLEVYVMHRKWIILSEAEKRGIVMLDSLKNWPILP